MGGYFRFRTFQNAAESNMKTARDQHAIYVANTEMMSGESGLGQNMGNICKINQDFVMAGSL